MGKKNLNADGLLNELKGNSSFFPRQPQTLHLQEQPSITNESKRSTPVRDVPPVPLVPLGRDVRPVPRTKRVMKQRHPFDIYHDQYETLKQLADEERRQGGAGSMSAMVREAIDSFIATKNRKAK